MATIVPPPNLYTDPRTRSHLRSVLARLNRATESLPDSLDDLTGQVGPHNVTFANSVEGGAPVYSTGADTADNASASAVATSLVIGVANEAASPGTGQYVAFGFVSQDDWTNVTGSVPLSAGMQYYLGVTVGTLTTTAPTTAGQVVVPVGIAISQTTLLVLIKQRILL